MKKLEHKPLNFQRQKWAPLLLILSISFLGLFGTVSDAKNSPRKVPLRLKILNQSSWKLSLNSTQKALPGLGSCFYSFEKNRTLCADDHHEDFVVPDEKTMAAFQIEPHSSLTLHTDLDFLDSKDTPNRYQFFGVGNKGQSLILVGALSPKSPESYEDPFNALTSLNGSASQIYLKINLPFSEKNKNARDCRATVMINNSSTRALLSYDSQWAETTASLDCVL